MLSLLDRVYRRAGTGLAFASLFLGGCFLAAVVIPCAAFILGPNRKRAQLLIHRSFRVYLAVITGLKVISVEIEGRAQLDDCRGCLIIANHPSLLDVVILMALIPNVQCVVKSELWNNRYLGGLVRRVGYIRNDLEPEELIAACKDSFGRGANIIVFPEGTRSIPGMQLRFQRGFANIATLTGATIQPVVITCTPPTLKKGEPWWAVPAQRPVFRISVKEPWSVAPELENEYRSITSRKLVRRMESYYSELLAHV